MNELTDALRTVVAVTATPYDAGGRLDDTGVTRLARRLVDGGVTVLTPNGNTGEFYSLSLDEADRVVALTTAAAGDSVVLAGVGHAAEVAAGMARRATDLGARAIMVHQPVHPYRSAAGWLDYHRRIAEEVPDTGIVVYLRDPSIGAATLAELADTCPNLVAVKYAVPNPVALADAVAAVGEDRLAWLCGLAETWTPYFWLSGARGFTSGLANVAPALSLRLLTALRAGDTAAAMSVWRLVRPFEDLRARDNSAHNVSAVKEALAQLGLTARTVRPPVSELDAADRELVTTVLKSWELA